MSARVRWRIIVLAVVAAILVGIGVVVVPYFFRAHPGAVSVTTVAKGFKGHKPSKVSRKVAYPPPAQGVYVLKGEGSEQIVFPPNSQRDGSTMPATVTYVSKGCWRWRVDYNIAHWEAYNFCPNATDLLEGVEVNWQSWDYGTIKVTNLEQVVCVKQAVVLPSRPKAGQTFKWPCTGTNTSVSGTTVQRIVVHIIGAQDLRIGRTKVATVHEVQDVTLSGVQHGTVTENWWFSATSGLPVRMNRKITINSSSPLGAVTYHEKGSWQMTSVHPQSAAKKSSSSKT